MNPTVKFVGWIQYMPTHHHAEFVVTGSDKLPDGAQVNPDTLRELKIPIPPFPSYWEWTRARFVQMLKNRAMLRELEK